MEMYQSMAFRILPTASLILHPPPLIEFGKDLAIYLHADVLVPMIIVIRHLFYSNYVGLCLWPFIILRHQALKQDQALINHERIHLRQQAELFLVFFYLLYLLEWVLKSLYYLDFYKAYRNISFEREAYLHENNLHYLRERKAYQGLKYIFVNPMDH
jgi:hypothetical protein